MKLLLLVLVGLILQQPSTVLAQTTSATIVSVGDGDTVRVRINQKLTTIRLACADAPEIRQTPYENASASRLKQLLPIGKSIDLRAIEKDKYGRTVGEIFVNNKSINLQMVAEGQAVVYRQYLKNCSSTKQQYLAAEANAKKRKLGFWNQPNPIMPWDFRRGKTGSHSRSTSTTQSSNIQKRKLGALHHI